MVQSIHAFDMRNNIQPREYSKGGDKDDTLYISSEPERQPLRPVSVLKRWQVELERQLARQ